MNTSEGLNTSLVLLEDGGYSYFLKVLFYYESGIRATEDEPECPEYIELRKVCMNGYDENILDSISDKEYETILTELKKQTSGYLKQQPIRTKFCTSDNIRLPDDDSVMRKLGFGLINVKEWERD